MGANNINPNSNYDSLRTASCTSAPFQKVDLSSYWAVRFSDSYPLILL